MPLISYQPRDTTSGEMFGTNSVTVFDADNNPLTVAVGSSEAYSTLLGTMSGTSENWGEGRTTSQSVARGAGWSEAMMPELEERAGGVYSLEEQRFRFAVAINRQGIGKAAVQLLGEKAAFVSTESTMAYQVPPSTLSQAVGTLLEKSESATALPIVEREIWERKAALEAAVRSHAGHPFTGGKAIDLTPEDNQLG